MIYIRFATPHLLFSSKLNVIANPKSLTFIKAVLLGWCRYYRETVKHYQKQPLLVHISTSA
jgi:hypothetical protein